MIRYVGLLRGINVGGNKKVPMAVVKKLLEKNGYANVKTLLASGNVIFDAAEKDPMNLRPALEKTLEKGFGFPIPVILRTQKQIEGLMKSAPFKKITVTPETRRYVTFLSAKPTGALKLPYVSADKAITILGATDGEVMSVLIVTPDMNSPKAMEILEKEYGKNITTRNWNTVEKLLL